MLLHCPRCHARQTVSDIPSGSSLCHTCGADVVLIEAPSPSDPSASGNHSNQLPVTTSQPHGSGHDSSFEVTGEFTVPERLGRYHIVGFLGGGGFANVYLAEDTELDRQVALKVPRAERFQSDTDVARFLQEARVLAKLTHPSIVQVYDVGECDGIRYIVTQYIDGQPLTQRLRRDGLSGREIASLMIPCAQALHSAHLKGVFHRDFKPSNVLQDHDGKPFVADFGLAIARHRPRKHAGDVAGTISYMSPEQISGDAHLLDGRSDIWSVGVVIYQMLTGELPFRGSIN